MENVRVFTANLDSFTTDEPVIGESKWKTGHDSRFEYAIKERNHFSIEIWTDTILDGYSFSLYSISEYTVNNYAPKLEEHFLDNEELRMLSDAFLYSDKKHTAKIYELNKDSVLKDFRVTTVQTIEDIVAMNKEYFEKKTATS